MKLSDVNNMPVDLNVGDAHVTVVIRKIKAQRIAFFCVFVVFQIGLA